MRKALTAATWSGARSATASIGGGTTGEGLIPTRFTTTNYQLLRAMRPIVPDNSLYALARTSHSLTTGKRL
jgi:hypothetical protein